MAGNIKQFLLNEQLGIELVSETATLYICDPLCEELTNDSGEIDHRITIAIWIASSALVLLFAILVVFLTYKYVTYIVTPSILHYFNINNSLHFYLVQMVINYAMPVIYNCLLSLL